MDALASFTLCLNRRRQHQGFAELQQLLVALSVGDLDRL